MVQQGWCQLRRGSPPPVSAPPAARAAHPPGMTAAAQQCGCSTPTATCSAAHWPGLVVCDTKQGLWGPLHCAIPPPCRDVHINTVEFCFISRWMTLSICLSIYLSGFFLSVSVALRSLLRSPRPVDNIFSQIPYSC